MINDDCLVKYSVERLKEGYTPSPNINNWVDYTKMLFKQIREIRDLDFTAIGLGDLSLIRNTQVKEGMRIILCDNLDGNNSSNPHGDSATILGIVTRINPEDPMIVELEIEGLGHRCDSGRDPNRVLTWGMKIYPNLRDFPCILEMTSKPKSDGGSVYYFYNKSSRDSRENYVPGKPALSSHLIVHSLMETSRRCIENLRERAQYMHYFRRVFKEICGVLNECPEIVEKYPVLIDLYYLFNNSPLPTKNTCIELSKNILTILHNYNYYDKN